MKRFAFRVDASSWMGSGHVMRCATFASHLQHTGHEIHFVCREMPGDYCAWLRNSGFMVHLLPRVDEPLLSNTSSYIHGSWLGVKQRQDIEDCHDVLQQLGGMDWLVVDHYGLGRPWQASMRANARKIMVIDDLADRDHDCDVLLDQNYFDHPEDRYRTHVPDDCHMLLGPAYALLQPEYARLHQTLKRNPGDIRRILVYFGAADQHCLTEKALSAVARLDVKGLVLDVVYSGDQARLRELIHKADTHANINVHAALTSLAPLMASADLAIGAAGATTWERCCLGLPSIVISLAENQKYIAEQLNAKGLVRYIGESSNVGEAEIYHSLEDIVYSGFISGISENCLKLVDGKGVGRVSQAIRQIDGN